MNTNNNWVKYLVSVRSRQGENGEITLPGDKWNGFFCFAYGTDKTEAGRKMVEWWFREYSKKTEHWRTGPFSDDFIYTYSYLKTKDETKEFLNSISQKMTFEELSKGKEDITRGKLEEFFRENVIYIAAAILAVVVIGGGDD